MSSSLPDPAGAPPATAPYDPVAAALAEDLGDEGDLTVRCFVDPAQRATAQVCARQPAVVAGTAVAVEVFRRVDPDLRAEVLTPDGTTVATDEVLLTVAGSAGSILTAERTALNFLQRLSGVATLTRRFVDAVRGHDVQILDTRKTTPGLRRLEKEAVRAGGGHNHRFGLFDRVIVKDNHLLAGPAAGTPEVLQRAVDQARSTRPGAQVELEADTLAQVEAFLALRGVDWILLDNMSPDELRQAVALRRARHRTDVRLEASGGVRLETVAALAATGVDAISVGALTHSAPAVDLSLEFLPTIAAADPDAVPSATGPDR